MAAEDQKPIETSAMTNPTKPERRKRAGKRRSANGGRARARSRSLAGRSMPRSRGRSASAPSRRRKRLVEEAQNWAEDARRAVPRLARNMHLPSPPSIETFTEANPVILGAVGLGIGVIIGALLPRDVFQGGMQSLGLMGAETSSRSPRGSGRSSRSKR
jgi:hypothetical protein